MNPRFAPTDPVMVLDSVPPGHVRTPFYCRGKQGFVVECLGSFPNPESLAYRHMGGESIPLYRVRFRIGDIWSAPQPGDDQIEIEIFEHWLRPA
jgi:hypothetical protein